MLALKDQLRVLEALKTGLRAARTYSDILGLIAQMEIGGNTAVWEGILTTLRDGKLTLWVKELAALMDPHVALLVRVGINHDAGIADLSPALGFVHLLLRHEGSQQFEDKAAGLKGELALLEALKACARTGAYAQCFDLMAEYEILDRTQTWQTTAETLRADGADLLLPLTTCQLSAPVGELLWVGVKFSFGWDAEALQPAIDYLHTAIQRAALTYDFEPAAA